jgi:nucleotide-binding universal stress UspA family protein
MRVLVAYDGSASAQAALQATAELLPGAEAVVLTVYEAPVRLEHLLAAHGPTPSPLERDVADIRRLMEDEAKATAREGAELASEAGLAATAEIAAATGSAWPVILAEATQRESAALVCGTRGRGGLSRAWLGSTSSALLHHATLPIFVVPERSPEPSGPLLLAYDGSEPARIAVTNRRPALSRPTGSRHARVGIAAEALVGRSCAQLPADHRHPRVGQDLDEILANSARQQAEEGAELARQWGLEARSESVESAAGVWRSLLEATATFGAGVIVAGSRGRGAIASTMLGSVSSGLVHNAELPVLIVPSLSAAA